MRTPKGARKVPAIRAALAAVKANVLITDSDSAAALTRPRQAAQNKEIPA